MALYLGTNGLPYPASPLTANAFIRAIESPMFFTANTIDQPGKQVALATHGHWLGGDVPFDEADSWLLVGTNPLISKAIGIPGQNPGQGLRTAISRGMKLIVIDPRRSQTAARAAIHIQPRPGEDVAILAGMINWIVRERNFVTQSSSPRTSRVSMSWPPLSLPSHPSTSLSAPTSLPRR